MGTGYFAAYALAITVMVVSGLFQNKWGSALFILTSLMLSLSGAYGILTMRGVLLAALEKKDYLTESSIEWMLGRYNLNANVVLTVTLLTFLVCTFIIIVKNISDGSPWITATIITVSIIIFLYTLIVTFNSISKYFNLGSYMMSYTAYCILLLFGIFTVKRLKELNLWRKCNDI